MPAALLAGYLGGTASNHTVTAKAQGVRQQNPATILQQGFDTQGNIIVPAQGLSFVNTSGRVIAHIGGQGSTGYMTLNNGEGQAAVTLVAGLGARFVADTSNPGGSVVVGTPDGTNSAKLAGTVSAPTIELVQGGKPIVQLKAEPNRGASFSMWHSSGQPEFMVGKEKDGPFWRLTSEAGVKLAEVSRHATDGTGLYVRGPKDSLEGWYRANRLQFFEAGESKVEFPAKED